jgi:hypothetical protein
MATLRVLPFIAFAEDDGDLPRRARWTAATALGGLVTTARAGPTTTASGTAAATIASRFRSGLRLDRPTQLGLLLDEGAAKEAAPALWDG